MLSAPTVDANCRAPPSSLSKLSAVDRGVGSVSHPPFSSSSSPSVSARIGDTFGRSSWDCDRAASGCGGGVTDAGFGGNTPKVPTGAGTGAWWDWAGSGWALCGDGAKSGCACSHTAKDDSDALWGTAAAICQNECV